MSDGYLKCEMELPRVKPKGHLQNMRITLEGVFDPDTWMVHIDGKFALEEIPSLVRLLEIYTKIAHPLPAPPKPSE